MQVLKLSFFPLLSLSREEERKCDQEATDCQSAKAEGD